MNHCPCDLIPNPVQVKVTQAPIWALFFCAKHGYVKSQESDEQRSGASER